MSKADLFKKIIIYLFAGMLAILVIATGFLYQQKTFFQKQNRELIIQNDSIVGVNINLTNALETKESISKGHPIVNIKPGKSR